MNTTEVLRLLEKYYDGSTSFEEENALRRYFSSGHVPSGLAEEKAIFRYYLDSASIPDPSAGLEDNIIAAISRSEKETPSQLSKRIIKSVSVAASILLLIGSYIIFTGKGEPADTFTDPDLAYAETIQVLQKVSAQFNRGTEALKYVDKVGAATMMSLGTINETSTIVESKLGNIEYVNRALEMLSSYPVNSNKQPEE